MKRSHVFLHKKRNSFVKGPRSTFAENLDDLADRYRRARARADARLARPATLAAAAAAALRLKPSDPASYGDRALS